MSLEVVLEPQKERKGLPPKVLGATFCVVNFDWSGVLGGTGTANEGETWRKRVDYTDS